MKRLVYFFVAFFLALSRFLTPFAKAQGTFTAPSCNQTDVDAVINGAKLTAVDGDTINIPAGTSTWTSGVTVPSGIGITIIGGGTPNPGPGSMGAGTVCTKITRSISGGYIFVMRPTHRSVTSRISSLTLLPQNPTAASIMIIGTCTATGCSNMRIGDLEFPSKCAGIGISDDAVVDDNVFGVLDNADRSVRGTDNGVTFLNVNHSAWKGVGQWRNNCWASTDTFLTAQTLYREDSIFNNACGTDTNGSYTDQEERHL